MSEYLLTPPSTVESFGQYDRISDPLWRWMRADVALSLVKIDGVWQTARLSSYPDLEVLEGYYQGGYTYTVDQATADELIADGFGDNLVIILSGYAREVYEDEPLIWLRMDDSTPAVALRDSSGNDYDPSSISAFNSPSTGIVTGSPAAVLNTGSTFNKLFQVQGFGNFITEAPCTVEGWVKGSEFQSPGLAGSGGPFFLALDVYSPGAGGPGVGGPGVTTDDGVDQIDYEFEIAVTGLDDGAAHHYVIRLNLNETVDLFIDGTLRTSESVPGPFAAAVFNAFNNGGDDVWFDELAVYSTALPDDRIQAHYEAGTT